MTRENKLALVVGFALILFVGILISDHFSTARNQAAANLTRPNSIDPLITRTNSNVIDLQPRTQPPPTTLINPTTIAINGGTQEVRPVTDDPNGAVRMGEPHTASNGHEPALPDGFTPVDPEPDAQQIRVVYHDVRGGETLFAICRQHYGDASLMHALAQFNKVDDPANLRVGRRLRIPPAAAIGGRASAPATAPSSTPSQAPVKPANTTYTVKAGDSLAQIAHRFLGSKSKWKKLHDMNRDVIDDPDSLKVGTVLKVL